MPKIPFVGPSYQDRSLSFDAQRALNLYPIASEVKDSKDVIGLRATPGLFQGFDTDTYFGYDLDGATPVQPPPQTGVPSGQPFIIDLSFPGLCSNITSGPVYTFLQDVKFPAGPFIFGPLSMSAPVFTGSSATIVATQLNQVVEFAVSDLRDNVLISEPADNWGVYSNTAIDGVGFQIQVFSEDLNDIGILPLYHGQNAGGIGTQPWLSTHYLNESGNEFIVFHAGESLYLSPFTFWGVPTFFQDLTLHIVGTAV